MKMAFSSANKAVESESFPKLKLDQGETARIYLFETPDVAYVHNFRAPKVVNGELQYKTVETKNGPDQQMDYAFIGNPICLGDYDTITERGLDPKACPACAAAQDDPDKFAPPKRRFAMHVFQYQTNGTSKPTKAFQGSVKVWSFTDQKFAEIVDLMDEAPEKSLANIDLILGPCENKLFQKYKMISSSNVKAKENEAYWETLQEITAENKAPDLRRFLGRVAKKDWIEDQIVQVKRIWAQANGQKSNSSADGLASAEPNFDAGLKDILNTTPSASKSNDVPSGEDGPVDFDKLLNGI
jgi:hypothetical protein